MWRDDLCYRCDSYSSRWSARLPQTLGRLHSGFIRRTGGADPALIPLILFGVSTNTSIGQLFIAGIGPGLLVGGALLVFVYIFCKLRGFGLQDRNDRTCFTTGLPARLGGDADASGGHRRHLWRDFTPTESLGGGGVLCLGWSVLATASLSWLT